MKIFVVGPESGDFFAHNVAVTCREMGHEVCSDSRSTSLAAKGAIRANVEDFLARSSKSWRHKADQRIVDLAVRFQPKLTIVCTTTLEPDAVLRIRKKTGGMVICWFGDSPANVRRDHITAGEYDAVFSKDRRFATDLSSILGIKAFHLHEACNPLWHRPVSVQSGGHIAVAGTLYGYRIAVIRKLLEAGWPIEIFGPRPSSWVSDDVARWHTGIFLDHTNKANAFCRALACLNTFSPAERDSLNCRIFETCGCGGLLVSERKDAMDDCFDPYEEYLPFGSSDELLEQLARAKGDKEFVRRVRASASRRAHAQHSYRSRISFILDTLVL